MLRRWLYEETRISDARRGPESDDSGSQGERETRGGQNRKEVWHIAALRAVGSLALIFFFAMIVLWLFVFRGLPLQAVLSLSVGGFLGSWIAAAWGVEGATYCRRKKTSLHIGTEAALGLARCGFFLGIFSFVAFFLLAHR